jgi:hypothetical protein
MENSPAGLFKMLARPIPASPELGKSSLCIKLSSRMTMGIGLFTFVKKALLQHSM